MPLHPVCWIQEQPPDILLHGDDLDRLSAQEQAIQKFISQIAHLGIVHIGLLEDTAGEFAAVNDLIVFKITECHRGALGRHELGDKYLLAQSGIICVVPSLIF